MKLTPKASIKWLWVLAFFISSEASAQEMATSTKMIRLKTARHNDLVLCATNKANENKLVISMALIVTENSGETLTGETIKKVFPPLPPVTKKYQELMGCEKVLVIAREQTDDISLFIAGILINGLPLTIYNTQPPTPHSPEPSPPAIPTSRRSYL